MDENEELKNKVRLLWQNKLNDIQEDQHESTELWKIFTESYLKWKQEGKIKQNDLSIEALVLTYLYPRIDVNVSTGINHLLKSPWCVHPKTGKFDFELLFTELTIFFTAVQARSVSRLTQRTLTHSTANVYRL